MKRAPSHFSLLKSGRISRDRSGSFAIMTALILPVMFIVVGTAFEAGFLVTQHKLAERMTAEACTRAVKPTRTMTPSDAVRIKQVLDLFDRIFQSKSMTVRSRDAAVDWLDVTLNAEISYHTVFAKLVGVNDVNFSIKRHCAGIPPFPHDGEIVLSSDFVKPDGAQIPLRENQYSCMNVWDVYKYSMFGWDDGTGPGVEIQDWSKPGCFGTLPPSEYPSKYVVELDSSGAASTNSSITKIIELHPGQYEISCWYNGRIEDTASNIIAVYTQAQRPTVGPRKLMFRMSQRGSAGWKRFSGTVTVDRYSIYKITIAAEGKDDSFGGLINAFNVKFIDTNDKT